MYITNLTHGRLSKANKAKRDRFVAAMWGLYDGLMTGTRTRIGPVSRSIVGEEYMREAFEIRKRLGLRWGGAQGLKKTARIIRLVENMAENNLAEKVEYERSAGEAVSVAEGTAHRHP
jgi:hypothetical protein